MRWSTLHSLVLALVLYTLFLTYVSYEEERARVRTVEESWNRSEEFLP